ncbi:hypothetical protein CMV_022993 [Castanea mollissima]|uniref:Retrovirus-related Pol polyprotein from transposon TNT 1-94-like beta-barrel domain-containing protein n=1 Tax=Castanea mollissima TaxID=60419 RepID=A0A8J4QCW7_9ROSI|nr:hypothetical protein CMV_022993 [Castanea mollissima]
MIDAYEKGHYDLNSNVNQVSYTQGQSIESSSNASAQCPISKAQCEQLLALFNSGIDQGNGHHVAIVSTSGAVSSVLSRALGVFAATGAPSTSISSSNSVNSSLVNTMLDTGATNHLTSDLSNLNLQSEEYVGTDQIHVGNGAGLAITHIGSSSLPSSSKSFILQNVLHVAYLPSSLPSILGSPPAPQSTATSSVSKSPPTPPSSSSSPPTQQLPLADSNPQAPPAPPQNIHPMQTRSKSNIFKPKHPLDARVAIAINKGEDLLTLVDDKLEGNANMEELTRACKVACCCIQDNPRETNYGPGN